MREAIYTAIHIVKNRKTYEDIHANPLPYPKPEDRKPKEIKPFDPSIFDNNEEKENKKED